MHAKLEKNDVIEELLKELLIEYDIIPKQNIKNIMFMKSKPRNNKIGINKIYQNNGINQRDKTQHKNIL